MLKHPHPLDDVMDSFKLSNVVLGHTCFRNVENSSSIDVILTNTPRRLTSVLNVLKPDHPLFDWLTNYVILNHF